MTITFCIITYTLNQYCDIYSSIIKIISLERTLNLYLDMHYDNGILGYCIHKSRGCRADTGNAARGNQRGSYCQHGIKSRGWVAIAYYFTPHFAYLLDILMPWQSISFSAYFLIILHGDLHTFCSFPGPGNQRLPSQSFPPGSSAPRTPPFARRSLAPLAPRRPAAEDSNKAYQLNWGP